MQLSHVNRTVENLKLKFLDGWVISVGLSGKDSFCVAHCAVEALKQAKQEDESVGPLYLCTTNTTIDNFEIHNFIIDLHEAANEYAEEYDLPIRTKELNPSMASLPMVAYLGKGKLIRTPQTSTRGRDCTIDWKIVPMKAYLKSLAKTHQTDKILSCSGTRDDESVIRAANIKKRNEDTEIIVETDLGYTLAPIKDWSLTDVWSTVESVSSGNISSFAEDHADGLRKHYSAGNGGTCDLFAGANKQADKGCSSRFGCVLCGMVRFDNSLQQQILVSPRVYGYMQPMLDFREFMLNTLFDYKRSRAIFGRVTQPGGWVKVGHNQYSLEYRKEMLRYVLTMDANEIDESQRTGRKPRFRFIDHAKLLAIQYHWASEGGEVSCGEALQIWDAIHNRGERYAIPKTEMVENSGLSLNYSTLKYQPSKKMDEYRWVKLSELTERFDVAPVGLAPTGYEKNLPRNIVNIDGEEENIIPIVESQGFSVPDDNAKVFIEKTWPMLIEAGILNDYVDPTELLKKMLILGVVRPHKGTRKRLHVEAKRAQILNAMSKMGKYHKTILLALSINTSEYKKGLELASGVPQDNTQKEQMSLTL